MSFGRPLFLFLFYQLRRQFCLQLRTSQEADFWLCSHARNVARCWLFFSTILYLSQLMMIVTSREKNIYILPFMIRLNGQTNWERISSGSLKPREERIQAGRQAEPAEERPAPLGTHSIRLDLPGCLPARLPNL